MNRFIQTILFLIIFFSSAFGQEGEPTPINRDSLAQSQDTLSGSQDTLFMDQDTLLIGQDTLFVGQDTLFVGQDTLFIGQDTLFVDQDTLLMNQDSLHRNQRSDYKYLSSDPELWAARMREADSLRTASLLADSLLADSLMLAEAQEPKNPSKAIMYALVLPGLGQAYNGKYWKMPIVWAAIGGAGYAIAYNTGEYKQASYDYAQNPDDLNERYLSFWRRNMELSYIAMIAVYALQVLDAYVDAQLFSWDVNDNLSIGVSPSLKPLMAPGSISGYSYGLGCNFNIRGR
jgi:hypothetical protein